jgi:hypothetical protein
MQWLDLSGLLQNTSIATAELLPFFRDFHLSSQTTAFQGGKQRVNLLIFDLVTSPNEI